MPFILVSYAASATRSMLENNGEFNSVESKSSDISKSRAEELKKQERIMRKKRK
jgi:hypothetical protein